jgi:hypothetical protein
MLFGRFLVEFTPAAVTKYTFIVHFVRCLHSGLLANTVSQHFTFPLPFLLLLEFVCFFSLWILFFLDLLGFCIHNIDFKDFSLLLEYFLANFYMFLNDLLFEFTTAIHRALNQNNLLILRWQLTFEIIANLNGSFILFNLNRDWFLYLLFVIFSEVPLLVLS